MQKFKKFLTTPAGSWAKVFIVLFVGQIVTAAINNQNFFSWDKVMWQKVFCATCLAFFPMLVNALNPKYPLYGNKPKDDLIVDNPKVD